jgi:cytochrome c556
MIAEYAKHDFSEGRMKKGTMLVCGAAIAAVVATVASAQDVKPDRAIKYRQGILQALGWNMAPMAAMVKGEKPYDKDEFLKRATWVSELSYMPWEGFTPGSDQGAPTKAKPEIWKDIAKFKHYQEALQAATGKLAAAAKTGTLDAVKGPFGDVGKACGNCHDDFRAK